MTTLLSWRYKGAAFLICVLVVHIANHFTSIDNLTHRAIIVNEEFSQFAFVCIEFSTCHQSPVSQIKWLFYSCRRNEFTNLGNKHML